MRKYQKKVVGLEVTVPFEVKAVKKGNSIRVTLPEEIVDYLKIAEGDTSVAMFQTEKW